MTITAILGFFNNARFPFRGKCRGTLTMYGFPIRGKFRGTSSFINMSCCFENQISSTESSMSHLLDIVFADLFFIGK